MKKNRIFWNVNFVSVLYRTGYELIYFFFFFNILKKYVIKKLNLKKDCLNGRKRKILKWIYKILILYNKMGR